MKHRAAMYFAVAAVLFAQGESEVGRRLFLDACSACHGQSGAGGHGPSLIDSRQVRDMDSSRIFQVIQNGLKGTAMPASHLPDDQIRSIVAFVRSLSAPAIDSKARGDASAGKELFTGKAGCSGCHSIAGKGGSLGPDLTNAGVLRTLARLRESITDPDRRIPDDFRGVTVTTRHGEVIEGVVRNFDNYSLQMVDTHGKLHRFSRADLSKVDLAGHSLMPRDYSSRLTSGEIDNLVAYLARQSLRPRETQ